MMTRRHQKSGRLTGLAVVAMLLVAGLLTACGDAHDVRSEEVSPTTTRQPVEVVPDFSVVGTEELPEKLFISEVGLTVSEIRLEPMSYTDRGIVFASKEPMDLTFRVGDDDISKIGESMELPRPGRYLVSVRIESVANKPTDDEGSLRISGFAAGDGVERSDPRQEENVSDGSPVPVPADDENSESQNEDAETEKWTPFHYESYRSVYYTIGSVELSRGSQKLSFAFDIHDWALKLVEPVLQAVGDVNSPGADSGVDVTRQVDNRGQGPETFVRDASVQTRQGN